MSDKISTAQITRKAIVYVRQSTPYQVRHNTESTRLQYGLAQRARDLGFTRVEIIDDDLGRTGSGVADRTGFNDLVGAVCTSEVGAVFCIEDARLARNGREWHHLIDLCALTGTLLIDPRGVYDPRLIDDRLLLGFKGSMAEFELSLIRQRSFEAIQAKARRGELRFRLPVGLLWNAANQIERDPDLRVRETIDLVFKKFESLGSIRQVLQWFRRSAVAVPARTPADERVRWRLPDVQSIHSFLTNPLYAGAYAFGRTENRTTVVEGRARKTVGHRKPIERWTVLIHEHHEGYISWAHYERVQQLIAENSHVVNQGKIGRGGRCLLIGLLRCARCGRMMNVVYKGATNNVPRYVCFGAERNHGTDRCLSFGGLRVDQAIATELLRAVDGPAIDAAIEVAATQQDEREQRGKMIELELEQARYQARLTERSYHAVDPDNRLVAAELETRWNAALGQVAQLESQLQHETQAPCSTNASIDHAKLRALADDLETVWNAPSSEHRLKQRVARILMREVIADIDGKTSEVVLIIHWAGGRHSEIRVAKNKPGHTSRWTDPDAAKIIRRMAGEWSDRDIALTLNRMGLRSGTGLTWTDSRVHSIRHRMGLPAYDPSRHDESTRVSLDEACKVLGVSNTVVRRLIKEHVLAAMQVAPGAPWQIARSALGSPDVLAALRATGARAPRSRAASSDDSTPMIPGLCEGGAQ
jgi:excisionase family DNA binding protein